MKWRPLISQVGEVAVKCKRKIRGFQVANLTRPLFKGIASGETKGERLGRGGGGEGGGVGGVKLYKF